jgi:DNA-binding transcriptional ArsR family regulator
MLAREGELCAPELMARLDLHQSAVSRHLRQLVAAGYVSERWRDGSKCYRLNRDRIDDTLRALQRFLG